ncbi:heavy-metal-associated domain-containing protein [Planctomycetota bacterium]
MEKTYKVTGMTCGGCENAVKNALQQLSPELEVVVSFEHGTVRITGDHDETVIKQTIEDAGFSFDGPSAC